jgi:hypothetical protein
MRRSLILALALPAMSQTQAPARVRVDLRVEVASVVCRLAGYPEFQAPGLADYDDAALRWFGAHRHHPTVKLFQALKRERGMGYNGALDLALLAVSERKWTPRVPLNPRPATLDDRWDAATARRALAALGAFAKETRASAFFASQAPRQREAEAALAKALEGHVDLDWHPRVFAPRGPLVVQVVPGLLVGPNNYGIRVEVPGQATEIIQIIGTPQHRSADPIAYPQEEVAALQVHELGHPFVNPWVEAHAARLRAAGERLVEANRAELEASAYGRWQAMLNETFVRALAIRYFEDAGRKGQVRLALADDRAKGLLWTADFAEALKPSQPGAPVSFAESEPRLLAVLDRWAEAPAERIAQARSRFAQEAEARLKEGPQILSRTPTQDGEVAAGELILELRFDRPMTGKTFISQAEGPAMELTGKPAWDGDRSVLRVPVRLKPGRHAFELNREGVPGFAGKDGESLTPQRWTFTVR